MNINKYKNTLIEFGLKENEVKVYLSALSSGPTTILSIARDTGIRRTTVYEIIKLLISKSLMVTELKGFKKLFCATHPQNLITIFENKKDKLETIVPELSSFYKIEGAEDTIKTYQSLDSIKSLYREILASYCSGDFCYIIGNNDKFFALDPKFFNKYIEDRAKLNVDVRIIVDDSESSRERKKYAQNFNSQVRILPKDTAIPANFTVTSNIFLTQTLENKIMALTISNKDVINLQKSLFEVIWNSIPE